MAGPRTAAESERTWTSWKGLKLGCDQRFFPDTVRTMTTADEQVFLNGKIFIERDEEEFASAFKISGADSPGSATPRT